MAGSQTGIQVPSVAEDGGNEEALSFFHSLLRDPQPLSLERVMNENFCFNLKLEQYARLCNCSRSAFKRDFQKQFNSTRGRWLLEKRLQKAYYLLTDLKKPINETAFECGFENLSHFSRCFKEQFKTSPAAARQKIGS